MALKSLLLVSAALLLRSNHVLCKNINTYAGPYIACAHRFEVCPSDGTVVIVIKNSHFSTARPFERQWIWTNATVKSVIDDSYWVHVTLATRSNNEWKENAFVLRFPGGACSSLREHAPAFFHMVTAYEPEQVRDKKNPCRVHPGEFQFRNQTMSWEFPNFKIVPYGHYRFSVSLGKGSAVKKMCLDVDCEAIPKPSR